MVSPLPAQIASLSETSEQPPQSKLRLWFALAAVLVVVLALVVARRFSAPKLDTNVQWVEVHRADFRIVCLEEGELHPVQVTTLAPQTNGMIGSIVPDGSHVKKGEKV